MVRKIIFIIILLFLNSSIIYADNCGGNKECKCGDTVTSDYVLKEDLVCNGTALNFFKYNNVDLDCNGHKIIGNGKGDGILLRWSSNNDISNCYISGFENGISIPKYKYNGYEYFARNTRIYDNKLIDNKIGIKLYESSCSINIFNNNFVDNNVSGLFSLSYRDCGKIWNNTFYDKGIYYKYQSYLSFCNNNESNFYYDDATGPQCSCLYPYDGLYLIKNVKFCNGEYNLPNGIKIQSGLAGSTVYKSIKVDCQNSTFYGNGQGNGITLLGSDLNVINNCNIKNYTNGVFLDYRNVRSGLNYHTYYSNLNKIYNSKILNVENGFYMKTKSDISGSNNIILAKNKNFIAQNNLMFINLSNNHWGSDNLSLIKSKISGNPAKYIIEPLKTLNKYPDLVVRDVYSVDDDLVVNVENKGDFMASNFDLKILQIFKGNVIKEKVVEVDKIIEENGSLNVKFDFKSDRHIYDIVINIDNDNSVRETDELNNFYSGKIYVKKDKFFLDIDLNRKLLNEIVRGYIVKNIGKDYIVNNENESDIVLKIGDGNLDNQTNNLIAFLDSKPYAGTIVSNKTQISLVANEEDGYVYLVKYLLKNFNDFLKVDNKYDVNNDNIDAIGIYDYIKIRLLRDSRIDKRYIETVNNALSDKMYNLEKKEINISLNGSIKKYNLQHLISEKSEILKSYIDEDSYPIVMAGGLWSDITTWEDLGEELSNIGYNVYLIELTGGEQVECESCYNYNYSDLTDSVYPAYINYILNDSLRDKVKYVGHSNGGRVAIDSLSKNKTNQDSIDTLVLVGVPGAFENMSSAIKILKKSGGVAIKRIRRKNMTHITFSRLAHELESRLAEVVSLFTYFGDNGKISINLFEQYYKWMSNITDEQPGKGIEVDHFTLIYGNALGNSDGVVSVEDELEIFKNIKTAGNNKQLVRIRTVHNEMSKRKPIQDNVIVSINKEIYEK